MKYIAAQNNSLYKIFSGSDEPADEAGRRKSINEAEKGLKCSFFFAVYRRIFISPPSVILTKFSKYNIIKIVL